MPCLKLFQIDQMFNTVNNQVRYQTQTWGTSLMKVFCSQTNPPICSTHDGGYQKRTSSDRHIMSQLPSKHCPSSQNWTTSARHSLLVYRHGVVQFQFAWICTRMCRFWSWKLGNDSLAGSSLSTYLQHYGAHLDWFGSHSQLQPSPSWFITPKRFVIVVWS
jgi:hypothetical protein